MLLGKSKFLNGSASILSLRHKSHERRIPTAGQSIAKVFISKAWDINPPSSLTNTNRPHFFAAQLLRQIFREQPISGAKNMLFAL